MSSPADGPVDLRFSEAELEATRKQIVSFIDERVTAAGVDGVVIGLSGGIDSSLTVSLAVDALGPEAVHGLVMPSEVDPSENMSDAEQLAEDLGIQYDVMPIAPVAEAFLEAIPDVGTDDERIEADPLRTAVGKLRVRIRAVTLYFTANAENAIVLGTGNRTEALVGYFTKYGDGAVDCLPIGNLYKVQVRQLARHMDVPESIVTKTPTAGLWAGQTDEEELGIDYDTLDRILALSVDGPLSPTATARLLDDVSIEIIERVHNLYHRSDHKRHMPPAPEPQT